MAWTFNLGYFAVFASAASLSYTVAAAQTYIFDDFCCGEYRVGILNLSFEGEAVTGILRPLEGAAGAEVEVFGENYAQGMLSLRLPTRQNRTEYIHFQKRIDERYIRWEAPNGSPSFYRFRNSDFSEATRTLYVESCGPEYGALEVRSNSLSVQDLVTASGGILAEEDFLEIETGRFWVVVEVGSEVYLTKRLRAHAGVDFVNLPSADCGGAESSYFVIDRSLISRGPELDAQMYLQFLRSSVEEFLSRRPQYSSFQSSIQQRGATRSAIPPHALQNRISIIAPSFATREWGRTWDRFELSFATADIPGLASNEVGIVVYAERLFTGDANARPGSPPPRTEFISNQLHFDDEATIAVLFASFVSRAFGGRCAVYGEGMFEMSYEEVDRVEYLTGLCNARD